MNKYVLTQNAKDDIFRIYRFGVQEFGETAADSYFESLFSTFNKIAENPHLSQSIDHIRPGYRRHIHRADNIYYRIKNDIIEITAVLGRQNLDSWL